MNLHAINANPTTFLHFEVAQSTLQLFFWGGKKTNGLTTRRTCPFPQKTPFQYTRKNGLTAV
jgi:hypothetical protein